MFQKQSQQLRHNLSEQWFDLKNQAEKKINLGKTTLNKAQSIGVVALVQTQIKTDVFIRDTAQRMAFPQAYALQQSLFEFSNNWMDFSIEGYDGLNAKNAIKAIRHLRLSDVLRVQHYEQQHKNRKTVLQSTEKILSKHKRGVA